MTEQDKKILIQLLDKYGSRELQYHIRLESIKKEELENLFIKYIYSTNIDPKTGKFVNPYISYSPEGVEYFSNGISSIFAMKEPIIKPRWLNEERKFFNKPINKDHQKNIISKQKVLDMVNGNNFELNFKELSELVLRDRLFSKTELELIQKLLKNPQIYMSQKEPAIIVNGDKGSAYILGKDKKGQRTF